jgi:HPt (histidine-containing phosphotransfer) domain-containing protein
MSDTKISAEVFDRLQSAMANDPAGLVELYRDFLTDAQRTFQQVLDACHRQDPEGLRSRAHYLKSSSLVLGAKELAAWCATLETMGRENKFFETSAALEQTAARLKDVEAELVERLGEAVLPPESAG